MAAGVGRPMIVLVKQRMRRLMAQYQSAKQGDEYQLNEVRRLEPGEPPQKIGAQVDRRSLLERLPGERQGQYKTANGEKQLDSKGAGFKQLIDEVIVDLEDTEMKRADGPNVKSDHSHDRDKA